jgi:hypothetical protein
LRVAQRRSYNCLSFIKIFHLFCLLEPGSAIPATA